MALLDLLNKARDNFLSPASGPAPAARESIVYEGAGLYGANAVGLKAGGDLTAAFKGPSLSIVLGLDQPGQTTGAHWSPVTLQGHALTFGATRSGKGVSVIVPALLSYGGSALVVDPKAEATWITAERRRMMGQRVVILDPWGETNRRYARDRPETVSKFNPLSALDPSDPNFADEVAAVADALVIASGGDPHWPESARELVGGLIAAMVETTPGKASLRQVRELLTASDDELTAAIQVILARNPKSLAARKLARFGKTSDEIGSIRSTAVTQTAILDSESLLASMETDAEPFNLADLSTSQITLFLVLPQNRLATHGRWLRLILTLALRAIASQASPPKVPILFMLDEAGSSLGNLSSIESGFGLLAGMGIRLWMFLQDLNQLKRDYPQSWETFIANSAVIQVLTARDNTTSEYFSQYLGTSTEVTNEIALDHQLKVARENTRRAKQAWSRQVSMIPNRDVDPHFIARPAMLPQEVRRLGADKLLVLFPGGLSYLLTKARYYDHSAWQGQFRPLPAFN